MTSSIQDCVHHLGVESKLLDGSQWMNAFLTSARRIMRFKQEQIIHSVAAVFIVYLILGWNIYLICNFVGFLFTVYLSLLATDSSITINYTRWFNYWIIYVLFGFLEYLCYNFRYTLRLFYIGKCVFLTCLLIPDLMCDNIITYYENVHLFIFEYFQQNETLYNRKAGQNNIDDAYSYDLHDNPLDREYDLGQDGAFAGYRILIGQFYKSGDMRAPIEALEIKGFHVENVKNEADFISKLRSNQYQIAWVISSSSIESTAFVSTLMEFHSTGGAVFLFADNVPYVSHASEFLNRKFGITLTGNYQGNKTLAFNENGYLQAGRFGQHEIFTGIKHLFEGVTICHPVYSMSTSCQSLITLATASDGKPCITAYDPPVGSSEGRLCLDCGFTKLFINWNSAGTARFIVNVSCWLATATK